MEHGLWIPSQAVQREDPLGGSENSTALGSMSTVPQPQPSSMSHPVLFTLRKLFRRELEAEVGRAKLGAEDYLLIAGEDDRSLVYRPTTFAERRTSIPLSPAALGCPRSS